MSTATADPKLQQEDFENGGGNHNIANLLVTESNRDGICEKCASIPWDELTTPSERISKKLPTIDQTTHHLEVSSCCICRFFADVIISRELLSGISRPPHVLQLQGTISTDHYKMRMLRFTQEDQANDGLGAGPHMLLVQDQSMSAEAPPDSIMLGDTPIELIRNSISTCEREHDHHCFPKSPDTLHNLKVLDCEWNEVVAAPPGCRYVALSYVWGQTQANSNNEGTFVEQRLPKTVSDSCFIAQKLGYKYLWVDRYCIDQGEHQEKTLQVAQMADIYSAAQLTIIAASGKDADHGLPGVTKITMLETSQASAASFHLLHYPKPFKFLDLKDSTWASRAWTFQECYFARRRLVFLDGQVTYLCNASSDAIRITGWLPHMHRSSIFLRNHMYRIKSILTAYTGRQLTYESDALAAIVSALTSFSDGALQHIWGVPLSRRFSRGHHTDWNPYTEFALSWFHSASCSRRNGFPSWSPIAWAGRVDWFFGLTASTRGIRALRVCESKEIVTIASILDSDSEDMPRYLEITAKMARLKIVTTSLPVTGQPGYQDQTQTAFLAFQLDDDLEIILHKPFWDADPSDLHEEDFICGVLLDSAVREGNMILLQEPMIMLIRRCGKYYERIGIMRLQHVLQHCYRLVVHGLQYLGFRQSSTGLIMQWDLGDLEHMYEFDAKDIPFRVWKDTPWKKFFVEDTIVLG